MKAYVITRILGTVEATVCAAPELDYPLQPVRCAGDWRPPPFDVRLDGVLTDGALQLATAILADWFGDIEAAEGDIAVLQSKDCRAVQLARAFAFDHFAHSNPLPLVLSGEHLNRWWRAHTPAAA